MAISVHSCANAKRLHFKMAANILSQSNMEYTELDPNCLTVHEQSCTQCCKLKACYSRYKPMLYNRPSELVVITHIQAVIPDVK